MFVQAFRRKWFSNRVLLPLLQPVESRDVNAEWDNLNFVYFVESKDYNPPVHDKYVSPKIPGAIYNDTRTKLFVPYKEREEVKSLGARFDQNNWFAPAAVNLKPFTKWLSPPKSYYLDVPYDEKDEAKLLGAEFDQERKKWFFDENKFNRSVFAKWKDATTKPVALSNRFDAHYLQVPFAEKDEVKSLGAKFDAQHKLWYFNPSIQKREDFKKWPDATLEPEVRVYLQVPFEEKDACRALGARFDSSVKRWYFDKNRLNPQSFSQWETVEADAPRPLGRNSTGGGGVSSIAPENKRFINVPFDEKEACKALGGKWDGEAMRWCYDASKPGNDEAFSKWPLVELEF